MTRLSNVDIERYIESGKIRINPYDPENLQGATIDFRIGRKFLIPDYYNKVGQSFIELDQDFPFVERDLQSLTILPHHFVLGTTIESLTIDSSLSARVDGKSRIGRKGLIVQTAGHIGPGFSGEITLELYNANQIPIVIREGQSICQIEFSGLKTPSTKPYSGRYLRQRGPVV